MSTLEQTRKARPAKEWTGEHVFRPLAQLLVDPAARSGLKPTTVVMIHTALGLLAAWQLRYGRGFMASRLSPALLLQLKTVLDGLDGQLARATGQTSEIGRYLDSEMDVVVNAALLCALLGWKKGLAANLLLSLILSADYVWERDHRLARGEVFRPAAAQSADHPALLAALRAVYSIYFLPQEKVLDHIFKARLSAATGGNIGPDDLFTYTPTLLSAVTANLGLATQLLALSAAILAGKPGLYSASLPVQAAVLLGLQVWREGLVRRRQKSGRT
jgi:archaetidylinositol phosphate synthase